MPEDRHWIDEVELEDVAIKWSFSHFDGREDRFNNEGDHNFQIILPEDIAMKMKADGWNIRTMAGYEEGDPDEHLIKVKISYKYEPPKVYLIKNGRKFLVGIDGQGQVDKKSLKRDLADIRRDTTQQIDVILTPSRWVNGQNSGITAYVKELYAMVKVSRFAEKYADYEEI